MASDDERREEWRREQRADREVEAHAAFPPPDACICGSGEWWITERTTYGEDADGNRGAPLIVWECYNCKRGRMVVYS